MVGTCGPKSSSAVTITALLTSIVNNSDAGLVTAEGATGLGCAIMVSEEFAFAGVAAGRGSGVVLSLCCLRKAMPTMKARITSPIIGKAHGDCFLSGVAGCFPLIFFLLMKV